MEELKDHQQQETGGGGGELQLHSRLTLVEHTLASFQVCSLEVHV